MSPRRSSSGASKRAILEAARQAFAELGYHRATMREIAGRADVDPSLIVHYFGSKQGLLVAALQPPYDPATVLAGLGQDPSRTGIELVRRLMHAWEDPSVRQHMLAVLRAAASDETAAQVLREIAEHMVVPVVAELVGEPSERHVSDDPIPADNDDGASAERRAALVAATMVGLGVLRIAMGVEPLARMSVDEVAAAAGPVVQHYLFGDL